MPGGDPNHSHPLDRMPNQFRQGFGDAQHPHVLV